MNRIYLLGRLRHSRGLTHYICYGRVAHQYKIAYINERVHSEFGFLSLKAFLIKRLLTKCAYLPTKAFNLECFNNKKYARIGFY
jgi:hypothetical protein